MSSKRNLFFFNLVDLYTQYRRTDKLYDTQTEDLQEELVPPVKSVIIITFESR